MAAIVANDFVDAAACGDLDGVKELLQDAALAPATINALDKDGRTAFHYACLNDDAPLLRVLLADARVDVLATSPRGDTGLHMAALYAARGSRAEARFRRGPFGELRWLDGRRGRPALDARPW